MIGPHAIIAARAMNALTGPRATDGLVRSGEEWPEMDCASCGHVLFKWVLDGGNTIEKDVSFVPPHGHREPCTALATMTPPTLAVGRSSRACGCTNFVPRWAILLGLRLYRYRRARLVRSRRAKVRAPA